MVSRKYFPKENPSCGLLSSRVKVCLYAIQATSINKQLGALDLEFRYSKFNSNCSLLCKYKGCSRKHDTFTYKIYLSAFGYSNNCHKTHLALESFQMCVVLSKYIKDMLIGISCILSFIFIIIGSFCKK